MGWYRVLNQTLRYRNEAGEKCQVEAGELVELDDIKAAKSYENMVERADSPVTTEAEAREVFDAPVAEEPVVEDNVTGTA